MADPLFASALLVEDERALSQALQIALRKLGISFETVTTLREARERISRREPEFLLLDRGLPDGDGLALCKELRTQGFKGLILVLTAAGDTSARVEGLNAGADDYLAKPFSWEELEARIRALARRKAVIESSESPERSWECDETRLRIKGPRGWIDLTPLEFKLASRLISAQGEIVSREVLLKEVWGFSFLPKTRTVDHFLGRLRKRFEKDPENPKHFITVRGAGYRFLP